MQPAHDHRDGAPDRCHKPTGHKYDHVLWTSHRAAGATRQRRAALIAQHDPEVRARREALAAKKLPTLQALAAELGYHLIAKKA